MLPAVQPQDQHHQHHLRTCQKCTFSAGFTSDLQNLKFWQLGPAVVLWAIQGILVQAHSSLGTTTLNRPINNLPLQIWIQLALAQDLLR